MNPKPITIAMSGQGPSGEPAYVICSAAADLRVNNVVDVPNVMVSALLPEDIFHAGR
jgi:formamidase